MEGWGDSLVKLIVFLKIFLEISILNQPRGMASVSIKLLQHFETTHGAHTHFLFVY